MKKKNNKIRKKTYIDSIIKMAKACPLASMLVASTVVLSCVGFIVCLKDGENPKSTVDRPMFAYVLANDTYNLENSADEEYCDEEFYGEEYYEEYYDDEYSYEDSDKNEEINNVVETTIVSSETANQVVEETSISSEISSQVVESTSVPVETIEQAVESTSVSVETSSQAVESTSESIETSSQAVESTSESVETANKTTEAASIPVETTSQAIEETTSVEDIYKKVDKKYFDDALFIGDSRVEGLKLYSGLDNATFYCKEGISLSKILKEKIVKMKIDGKKKEVTITKALKEKSFGKIYLMIGINEIGYRDTKDFRVRYKEVVDEIRKLQPEAKIIILGMMKVTDEYAKEHPSFSNKNIESKNKAIASLADNVNVFYLDFNPDICDSKGNVKKKYTWDGVHLKAEYYSIWVDFMKKHGI